MRIPIDSILVENRRRQEFGDISALARSIDKHGLLHPVIVANGRLVAGERRLRACQQLGWTEIDARDWGDLDEPTMQAIELEENEQRQNLTPHERSRDLTRKAAAVASDLPSAAEGKTPRGEHREYAAPKQDVADALGIGVGTLVRAEQHVKAVEDYPELADVPQSTALTVAKTLDALPEPERQQVREDIRQKPAAITDIATEARKTARGQAKTEAIRSERMLDGLAAVDPAFQRDREQAECRAYFLKKIAEFGELTRHDARAIAASLAPTDIQKFRLSETGFHQWLNDLSSNLPPAKGIRVVAREA